MADTELNALAVLTGANLALADLLYVEQGGIGKQIAVSEIVAGVRRLGGFPSIKVVSPTAHSVSTIAATKVTDLDMPLAVGKHWFDYRLIVRAATAGVMPQFNLNFGGTGAPVWWFMYADLSATLLAAIGQAANNVSTQTLGFQMAQAENVEATTAAGNMGPTGGLQATGQDHMLQITGIVVVTVAGNLELWHGSETATATTVEVGSSLVTHQVG